MLPVGGTTPVAVDVRVVAATNRVLEDLVKEGKFREDLYYRLAVISIHMPPLREREGDLERLISHFVRLAAERHAKPVTCVSGRAMQLLLRHSYPGNVRELENVIEHAVTLAEGDTLRDVDLPESLRESVGARPLAAPAAAAPAAAFDERDVGIAADPAGEAPSAASVPMFDAGSAVRDPLARPIVLPIDEGEGASLDEQLARREKEMLLAALARAAGVKKKAATLLGINYRSFRHRLQKYGIDGHGDEMLPRLAHPSLQRESSH